MIIEIKKGETNMTLYELLIRTLRTVNVTVTIAVFGTRFSRTKTCEQWCADKSCELLSWQIRYIEVIKGGIEIEVERGK